MSTEVTTAGPGTAIALADQVRHAFALQKIQDEQELKALAAGSADITKITNADGREQVHAAYMVLKNARVAIVKGGKVVRDKANQFAAGVIKEEQRLIDLIESEEGRLQKLRDEWDAAREAERQAAIDAEISRVANLRERVAELRGCPNLTASSGSALVADHISDLESLPADETLQEFQEQGVAAKEAGLARLRELHAAALAHETEQQRLKEEREDLARQRAAQKKIDDAAKAERDAEAARQAEELRTQRAAQDAENARIRAEQQAAQKKIDDDRAELARQQEILRKAQEPPPAPPPPPPSPVSRRGVVVPVPKASEMIEVLAKHYRARPDTIVDWLRAVDWNKAEAA